MEHEASLLREASFAIAGLTAPAQEQRHAFMILLNSVFYRCMVALTHGVTILKPAI